MKTAVFFGHRDYDYSLYRNKIRSVIVDLIENHDVKEFFNGYRGHFDALCAEIVYGLKRQYPTIKNVLVLSYYNPQNIALPKYFDESVYLLEKRVPMRFAITYTNQAIITKADYIISGVYYHYGGAYTAYAFAKRKKKAIINIIEDAPYKNE